MPAPKLRSGLLALAAATLTACALNPGVPVSPGASRAPGTRPSATSSQDPESPAPTAGASVAALPTPETLPSLGLLLSGQVRLDTSLLIAAGIAAPITGGAQLISNNGPGLISDKGVGLISNNSGSIISDNGAILISDNGAMLTSKTKFGLLQADAAPDRSLRPVQGMLVRAISLRTRQVLAGPVATDADGRYRLGFLTPPDGNVAVVAYVNGKETDAAYSFSALAAPAARPVANTESIDRTVEYMIRVLANRVQGGIDARLKGKDVGLDPDSAPDEASSKLSAQLAVVIDNVPIALMVKLDNQGKASRKFAELVASYIDLSKPVYKELEDIIESLREFDVARATHPAGSPSVPDAVMEKLYLVKTLDEVVPTLEARGMPHAEAVALDDRLHATSKALNEELSRIGLLHSRDVLLPLFDDPELADLKAIIELLLSQEEFAK